MLLDDEDMSLSMAAIYLLLDATRDRLIITSMRLANPLYAVESSAWRRCAYLVGVDHPI